MIPDDFKDYFGQEELIGEKKYYFPNNN